MENQEILNLFEIFKKNYDTEKQEQIWALQSQKFRDFWKNRILNNENQELNDSEMDEIIRILDRNAKGNTKDDEAVARVMIPQGVWRRMFNEIKLNKKLKELLNNLFLSNNDDEKTNLINELYKINEGKKNSLTGKSANAINAFLFVFNPLKQLSAVSLNDRKKIIDYFNFPNGPDFENDSPGKKIVLSNKVIIEGFRSLSIDVSTIIISYVLYRSLKEYWRNDNILEENPSSETKEASIEIPKENDPSLFYMESQLEDFIIENWDKTDFGKKYDLIEDNNGDLVSQQYDTKEVGKIDILAKDRKTEQYVVIELKRNQTSDDTVGQLARYMGWVEEKLSKNKSSQGIIIAAKPDKRLYYALKKIKDAKLFLYEVNFNLKELNNLKE